MIPEILVRFYLSRRIGFNSNVTCRKVLIQYILEYIEQKSGQKMQIMSKNSKYTFESNVAENVLSKRPQPVNN